MAVDISVIVCTHNRCRNLVMLLESFEKLKNVQDIKTELIIVDNNSTDQTKQVVMEFAGRSEIRVIYIHESRVGLACARNRGVAASKGEIVAFTDDDCIVDSDWLGSLFREFGADPALAGIGGRVELFDKRDKPITIKTDTERDTLSSFCELFTFMHGCNMAFSRQVFRKTGTFDDRFGAGTKIASAEDADFVYRAYKNGFKQVYSPDVCVYHNHGRRTESEISQVTKGYSIGRGAFYCKHVIRKDMNVVRLMYWETRGLIETAFKKLRSGESGQKAIHSLWYLLIGACYYLLEKLNGIRLGRSGADKLPG